jgi:hypothetical protein
MGSRVRADFLAGGFDARIVNAVRVLAQLVERLNGIAA